MSGGILTTDTGERAFRARNFQVRRADRDGIREISDAVAPEEPLDIRVAYWIKNVRATESFALAMRTPGHERELTAGLLLSEGLIQDRADLVALRFLGPASHNEILAELVQGVDVDAWRMRRSAVLGAGCGICGKTSIDQIVSACPTPHGSSSVTLELLLQLPALLEGHQSGFKQTGGLHAAALVTPEGTVQRVFEDIGRHNALDKLIGWCLLNDDLPLAGRIVFLSSRSSFELVQKTTMAGGSLLATVGGPSSLAIEAARKLNLTLVGFLRDGRCNIYSGDWRIKSG